MNPRNPPRIATWLLNYFRFTSTNPPLVGDLLEEFRDGRSAAWFWRQTLIVILTGFAGNARRFRRLFVARLIGWASASGVAFGFRLGHLTPRVDGLIALLPAVTLLALWFVLDLRRRRRQPVPDADSPEDWSELDEDEWRFGQRILFWLFAGTWFITCLMVYGIAAFSVSLFGPMSLSSFVLLQVQLLVGSVTDVVAPSKEPGIAVKLLTRERT